MKEQLYVVLCRHLQRILDHNQTFPLVQYNLAPVHHRIFEPHVTVLPTLEQIFPRGARPLGASCPRLPEPHEITAWFRLVLFVHPHCVVSARAPKVPAPRALRVVGISARVDEELEAASRQGERQGIRMPMCGNGLKTQWAASTVRRSSCSVSKSQPRM